MLKKGFEGYSALTALSIASAILVTGAPARADVPAAPGAPDAPAGVANNSEARPILAASETRFGVGTQADVPSGVSSSEVNDVAEEERSSPFTADYFGFFYGPSLRNGSAYQPNADGTPDPSRPVELQNRVGLTYAVNEHIAVTPTLYFLYHPTRGNGLALGDPYVRVSYYPTIDSGDFTLYSDVRFHAPISQDSRTQDMLAGFQTFQVLSWNPLGPDVTFGLNGSARYNVFGRRGSGNDLDLYLAPNFSAQISQKVSLTLLYELESVHAFGDRPFVFTSTAPDIEPGVRWDVSRRLALNPYLIAYPSNLNLRSTSLAMNVFWNML